MKFCANCETKSLVLSKKTIHVGERKFQLEVENCKKCERIYLSPKDQLKIDEWGNSLTVAVKDTQPYFTDEVYNLTLDYAKKYGLKWPKFVKLCTAFYLFRMTKDKNFKKIREALIDNQNSAGNLKKKKHSISINYRLFKQLELFSEVWSVHEANVIEDAVLCCVALLNSGQTAYEFKKNQLQEFVGEYAPTA